MPTDVKTQIGPPSWMNPEAVPPINPSTGTVGDNPDRTPYPVDYCDPGANDVIHEAYNHRLPFDSFTWGGKASVPGAGDATTASPTGRDSDRPVTQKSPLYSSDSGKVASAIRSGAGNELESPSTPGGHGDNWHMDVAVNDPKSKNDGSK